MNKKTLLMLIGVVLVIVSSVLGYFTDIGNDIPALIGTSFGLGIEIVAVWNKSTTKDWKVVVSIIAAVIGGVCCCFAGISEKNVSALVVAVIGVVALLVSIFTAVIASKKSVKTE